MKQYEYKLVNINSNWFGKPRRQQEIHEHFNQWGAQGWELVSLTPIIEGNVFTNASDTKDLVAVFKREIVS
ncbi:DUF4177 domain-containing protein [Pontibacter sp. G13]|uniref:DUF4177 domain-containing protein n=1 Tax=Pontibacter sp. G13 TaxID=3074898 RepID=UPI00288C1309|nr:DUF4177 domain-containing protein [Pontibacter sp. G13]WNJ17142.1 DUF4177 domain-containing protein [Pontibacter sp. G13]